MFNPSWMRINLLMFFLKAADQVSILIEDDAPRAGGTLVKSCNKIGHGYSFLQGI
jgi:hypothetical protein